MAKAGLIKWINLGNMLLLIVALAVPHWSHGSATNGTPPVIPEESGDLYFGLWSGCANINGRYIFRQPLAGGDDCRVGHCVEGTNFVATSRQDAMNLCTKSKVSAAFALLCLTLVVMAFYQTTIRNYFGLAPSHGWALICQFFIVIFSIVSWATWTGWQTQFNDQNAPGGRTQIGELKLGTGPVFMILVMLLAALNTWLEKDAYNDEQAEDVRRSAVRASQMEKRERLVSDDETLNDRIAVNPQYGDSDVATTKGPAPARPQVKPRRQDSASDA